MNLIDAQTPPNLTAPVEPQPGEGDRALTDSEKQTVEKWTKRIKEARDTTWKDVFGNMRENMNFAAGFQWAEQAKLHCEEYVANFTLRNLGQKVASLYARNPKAEYQRRPRLDFSLWDEDPQSIMAAQQAVMMNPALAAEAQAILMDFMHGVQERKNIDKVGKTLEILYQWNCDEHDPDFKEQMKQLVLRVLTCKVGFIRVSFETPQYSCLTPEGMQDTVVDRTKRLTEVMNKLQSSDTESVGALKEQMLMLAHSLTASLSDGESDTSTEERLVFDFPSSTSVIVDPRCKNLKGFVGAQWVVQEYLLPLDEVNAFFGTDVKGIETSLYNPDGISKTEPPTSPTQTNATSNTKDNSMCCLWEVLDKTTKSRFFILDGYKGYVQVPEPLDPQVKGFWPIRALVFNNVEMIPGQKASIYPPSDVDLLRPMQKEWNRARNSLRAHRKANAPQWFMDKNALTEADKDAIQDAEENRVIELEQPIPQGKKMDDVFMAKPVAPIDQNVYNTAPQMEDSMLTTGNQEANLGPVPSGQTATGQTIAEQSKVTVTTSNIDDLDDFLTWTASTAGQILLQKASPEFVQYIVGPGAAWPQEEATRQMFLRSIVLKVVASSSGRPNKALEIANFERIAPVIMQLGGNPLAVIEEAIKRLDDRLDWTKFFPLPGMAMAGQMGAGQPANPTAPPGQGPPPQQRPGPGKTGPQGQQVGMGAQTQTV